MPIYIKLTQKVELCDGKEKTDVVKMREPTVSEILALTKAEDTQAQEVILLSKLTNIPLDVLKDLNIKDYVRLGEGYKSIEKDEVSPKDYLSNTLSSQPKQVGQ